MLFLLLCVIILVSIAFLTLLERKILGYIQLRKGPNKLSLSGVLQPMSDGLKLFMKENYLGMNMNKFLFSLFPFLGFIFMFMFWMVFSFKMEEALYFSVILVVLISGIGIYSLMGSGWSSNSKYALLGAYRGVAQTISYEVGMVFLLIGVVFLACSYSADTLNMFNESGVEVFSGLMFLTFIWVVIMIAELNRAPFDFAEGESELVSGFNVEYGSSKFALFFLAEYGNILFMCYFTSVLFFKTILMIFLVFFSFFVVWVRGCYPRYRYDNLMNLAWKVFLPFILLFLMLIFVIKMLM